uniref:Complement factor H-related protein 2-like n=1 Tax=Maylandia zebra TaxID=106582 RepID=A0A3P9DTX8_9CICH
MRLSLILLFLHLWGHVEVSFSENVCSRLPNVPHSYVSENTKKVEYREGDVIHFTCETGYISGPTLRYICTNTGWESLRQGKCNLKPCELPEDVPNGYYEIIRGEELVFGTAIKYFCNLGYVTGLPQGNEAIRTGDTLHFRCADQYKLEGSEVIECLEIGYWNASFPSCSGRFTLTEKNSVRITSHIQGNRLKKGQKLTFTCLRRNHFMQGNKTVECLANGQWSDPFPTCGDPVGCGKPQPLSDGDTKISTKRQYSHGERVEYICQNYYKMEGTPYKTCENGKWTGQMRCLEPCTVKREDMSKHNIQFRYVSDDKLYSEHNDVIEFICSRGRRVGSLEMRQTCIEGVMHLPTCQ